MDKRVTMQDISDRLGLSRATVSRALRNHPKISQKTKELVNQIAQEMGFTKNPLISALVSQFHRSRPENFSSTIALIHCLPWGTPLHPHMHQFRESARLQAQSVGYELEEFHINEPGMTPQRLIRILKARGIHGLIMEHFWRDNVVLDINLEGFAYVAIGSSMIYPPAHRVDHQHFEEMQIALSKLLEYGYKKPLVAMSLISERTSGLRRFTAIEEFRRHKSQSMQVELFAPETIEDVSEGLEAKILEIEPDAVVSLHKFVLEESIRIARKHELDYGIACLGWNPKNEHFAGTEDSWEHKGRIAINIVVDQLNRNEFGVPENPVYARVKCRWKDGPSLPDKRKLAEQCSS